MKYGIYDTVDKLWIGTEDGPKLFDEIDLAMVAARIVDVRVGVAAGRHRAVPWQPAEVTKHDSVDTRIGTLEALVLLEEGLA